MWWLVAAGAAMALSGSAQAMSQAASEKFQRKQAALQSEHQSRISKLNAGMSALERDATMAALQNQALMQGLQDGQQMAKTKATQASSGVALNSKSKYMQRASEKLIHTINMANTELNRVNTLGNLETKKVNALSQSSIHQANANASTILANSINVQDAGWLSIFGTGANAVMQYGTAKAVAGSGTSGSAGGSK